MYITVYALKIKLVDSEQDQQHANKDQQIKAFNNFNSNYFQVK